MASAGVKVRGIRQYDHAAVRAGQRHELDIYLWSRAAIWIAAIFAFFFFEPNRHPNADRWDTARLHDLGYFTDIWARWDSDFFLRIAQNGYDDASAAFHPLYPALIAVLGRAFFGHYVLAGLVISLLCCLGSFVLLHGLAEQHLGSAEGATRSVLYLAVFPMTLFLQAVYSESLFLLLVLAAFALAERNRFAGAGLVAGLAILTRAAWLALLRRSRCWPGATATAFGLSPGLSALPMAAIYPLVLWQQVGDPFAFRDAQDRWHRHLSWAGPFAGSGTVSSPGGVAWNSSSSDTARTFRMRTPCTPRPRTSRPWRTSFSSSRSPLWPGVGSVRPTGSSPSSLAIPLSYPSSRWPLLSLPRFGLVIFPLFLALASLTATRPRLHNAVVACGALFLGIAVVQWALWQWVA